MRGWGGGIVVGKGLEGDLEGWGLRDGGMIGGMGEWLDRADGAGGMGDGRRGIVVGGWEGWNDGRHGEMGRGGGGRRGRRTEGEHGESECRCGGGSGGGSGGRRRLW